MEERLFVGPGSQSSEKQDRIFVWSYGFLYDVCAVQHGACKGFFDIAEKSFRPSLDYSSAVATADILLGPAELRRDFPSSLSSFFSFLLLTSFSTDILFPNQIYNTYTHGNGRG